MTRRFLFALCPLLLMWFVLPGCGSESDAVSMQRDGPAQVENARSAGDPVAEPVAESEPTLTGDSSGVSSADPIPPVDPVAPSAYVVIQNAKPADPQRLVRQLQRVLPKTQVVKQVRSPDPREIKLEVTNIKDVRALANKIPFASVESVDVAKRTITVDFDL